MVIPPIVIAAGGVSLLALLALQIAIGKRWIKFGRGQMKYHRWIAYLMAALALGHAFGGLVALGYIGL
ncbi:MAG: hypothetical protein C0418_01765 [Coriobacteriaceae bacterium]|nr:hypothetical protein [Coriobacteriaceae bacterium]